MELMAQSASGRFSPGLLMFWRVVHEPFSAKIEISEIHVHISTWPLVILPLEEARRPLVVNRRMAVWAADGQQGSRERSGVGTETGRSKWRRQQAQAPTGAATRRWATKKKIKAACLAGKRLGVAEAGQLAQDKGETEANYQVSSLNMETEQALEALAGLYERSEQANREIDKFESILKLFSCRQGICLINFLCHSVEKTPLDHSIYARHTTQQVNATMSTPTGWRFGVVSPWTRCHTRGARPKEKAVGGSHSTTIPPFFHQLSSLQQRA